MGDKESSSQSRNTCFVSICTRRKCKKGKTYYSLSLNYRLST